jgi:plastocyanin
MRRTPLIVAGAAALAFTLAACGGDDSTTSDTTPTAGEDSGPTLTVGAEDNLKFDAESYETEAGEVKVVYKNNGSVAHTLLIKDVKGFKLSVGREDDGTVDLEPGTYTLYCDVAGHEAAGMEAELTVS